ncbi:MAG: hypothetical protein KIT11_11935 [Fimbriimonadaceae bacterium]|nr:hypothetical protein [Fimbriimonadaceae bacterium]QYK55256.1 MAG: hypothetical protein KF733_09600 [Fimbriimonadaceae bacterium]
MSEEAKPKESPSKDEKPKLSEEQPVVTKQQIKGASYTVTTGRLPLRDEKDEIVAQVFFVAYTRDDAGADRPVTFTFNGGPGSPAIWLHMGALGPKRVRMAEDGGLPEPPYRLEDNDSAWLDFTDLVFVDPVGTGYSRARTPEEAEKFWGLKGDIESMGEFVRLYLTRNRRWTSPLYLAGESYGTTRVAGLAGHLIERGVAFSGICLVSSILNFQTARFTRGNDLPYVLFLPTYAAAACYHGKLEEPMNDLKHVVTEARSFAVGRYWSALAQGDRLDHDTRASIATHLSNFTGLSPAFIESVDLRINIHDFCKELLRTERRTVGRLDARVKGVDDFGKGHAQRPEHDPSMSALMPPYVATFSDYVRGTLGYESDLEYEIFRGIKKSWDWGSAGDGHPDTSEALRAALAKNPHMKVFVASGYYDLATPFFATEYTISHMGLDPSVRNNFRIHEYEAGHMMYTHEPSLVRLHGDVRDFFSNR